MWRRTFMGALAGAAMRPVRAQGLRRPILFLTPERLAALPKAIQTTHASLWAAVKADAESYARSKPPAYTTTGGNDEQLWQREAGNKLPFLAIAHLLTGESRFLDAAGQWSLAACAYPTWGAGSYSGNDLAAGHLLFGLALVYDWLNGSLPADTLSTIRATLLQRGAAMYQAALGTSYWRNEFLQNHLWVNITGLAAAGFALNEPATAPWIALVRDKYRRTEEALGPDGASHEGVGYWSYGVEYMLKYWDMVAPITGELPSSSWWANTAAYRLYLGLPRSAWTPGNVAVDLADSPRSDWYGPDYLLRRLAAAYRDPRAQWLAGELETARATQYAARWLNLIWHDPTVEARGPEGLPTLRHFEDIGIVSARSGWGGDESLVVFKCGPPLGHAAVERFQFDAGAGHVHPDANHFSLFGAGEWLLRDDGYAWKQTDQHNTLLVEGAGQLGEGSQWFRAMDAIRPQARPRIVSVQSGAAVDEMAGDAAAIYPAGAGLKRFMRRLFFWKPDVLIVVDEIETDTPRRLELRFHPESPLQTDAGAGFLARGRSSQLRIELLTPDGVEVDSGETPAKDRSGNPASMAAVRFATTRTLWRNAVALSWSGSDAAPARVTLDANARQWVFRCRGRELAISPAFDRRPTPPRPGRARP